MSFLHLATTRYTTKQYDPVRKIAETDIQALKEILRLCPSSINSQPWKFSFISDLVLKSQLADVSFHNTRKVLNASHIVVFNVIDSVPVFEADIKQRLPEPAVGFYNLRVKPLSEVEIKTWFAHQAYLALGFFLGACASMGIDSTPMEGIDTNAYNAILQTDKRLHLQDYKSLFAVAIGYRDPNDANQPTITPKKRRDLDEVVEGV
jgi:nitroreductase / dihydropteridine reductase